jgi:RNA polymerase sigma-70 factor (ECF subfamily)
LAKIKREPNIDPLPPNFNDSRIDWGTSPLDIDYLERAIKRLPPGYRSVFVLIEVEGYSHKEVAKMLGVSTGTTKSQLFYAKKILRDYISAEI